MTSLIKYDAACHALREAVALDDVIIIRDKAEAMRAYGKISKNRGIETDSAEIRLRAERRLGEMIRDEKASGGLNQGGPAIKNNAVVNGDRIIPPTLAEMGISKDLSSRAQKMAAISDDKFEEALGDWREKVGAENARVVTRLELEGASAQIAEDDSGETYSETDYALDQARDTIAELQDRLSGGVYFTAGEIDETQSGARARIKMLEAELDAVKTTRNILQVQNGELIAQVKRMRNALDKKGSENG